MVSRMKTNKEKLSLAFTSIDENFKYEDQFTDSAINNKGTNLGYEDIVIIKDDEVKS